MVQFSMRNMMLTVSCAAVLFRVFSVTDNHRGELTNLIGFLATSAALGAFGGAFVGRPIKWAAIAFAAVAFFIGAVVTIESFSNPG